MRVPFSLCVVSFSLLTSCTVSRHPPKESAPIRILFIGNSLTYTNDLPGMLENMSAHETPPLHCESVTFPGVSLAFHRVAGVADRKIKSHPWDYVLLQDYSLRPLDHPDGTTNSVRAFTNSIQAAGAKPLLFENWMRQDHPASYPTLLAHYEQITRDTGVPLVRIGEAWHLARERFPWFKPFIDERHPSPMGTYLAACVLYRTFYQHDPTDAQPIKGISPTQAIALQEIPRALPAPIQTPTTTTSR